MINVCLKALLSCLTFNKYFTVLLSSYFKNVEQEDRLDDLCDIKQKLKETRTIVLVADTADEIHPFLKSLKGMPVSVLFNPQDLYYLDLGDADNVALIEHFAGKYCFDLNRTLAWFHVFDYILRLASDEQYSFVLTCESSKLEKCLNEINPHHLLTEKYIIDVSHLNKNRGFNRLTGDILTMLFETKE